MSGSFLSKDEIPATTIVLAAAFLHALVSRSDIKDVNNSVVSVSFDLAESFIVEAQRRFP